MPQRDEPGRWGSTQQSDPGTQQGAVPGQQGGAPGQQGTAPGQQGYGQMPQGGVPGQPGGYQGEQGQFQGQQGQFQGQQAGQDWSQRPGSVSPVNEAETRVTGRRVVQYLIDAFLVALIPSLVSIPFDRSGSTFIHIIGGIVAFVLFVMIGLWYWVLRPHSHHGQTFGMKLLGLRVISKDGGPANMTQLFVRWICLIFDAIPYTWPFTGLVGFITILCSRHRQRIGDHLARTLVISTGVQGGQPQRYADAGNASAGSGGANQPMQ
jgi:uncharacterized RDD family membrane protein YckC